VCDGVYGLNEFRPQRGMIALTAQMFKNLSATIKISCTPVQCSIDRVPREHPLREMIGEF